MNEIKLYYGDKISLDGSSMTISYCDDKYIVANNETYYINDEHEIEGIDSLKILHRNEHYGVIETNGWKITDEIDILNTQTGDSISGTIVEIINDMVIVDTMYGKKYIDFAYRGIPLWLKINTREREIEIKKEKSNELSVIVFDETNQIELSEIMEVVPRENKLYSIEEQLYDMIESELFRIPIDKRTSKNVKEAKTLASQYNELRSDSFDFDAIGKIINIKKHNPEQLDKLALSFPTFIGNRVMSNEEDINIPEYIFYSNDKQENYNYRNNCFVKNVNNEITVDGNKGIFYRDIIFKSEDATKSLLPKDTSELYMVPKELIRLYNNSSALKKASFKFVIPSYILDKFINVINTNVLDLIELHLQSCDDCSCNSVTEFIETYLSPLGYKYKNLPHQYIHFIRELIELNVDKQKIPKQIEEKEEWTNKWELINPNTFSFIAAKYNSTNNETNWDVPLSKDIHITLVDNNVNNTSTNYKSELNNAEYAINQDNKWNLIKKLKYSRHKINKNVLNKDIKISPFTGIRDEQLKIKDLEDKYTAILSFCREYTREPILKINEDINWLYCINTSTKLLPVFIKVFAQKYFVGMDEYNIEVDRHIQLNGVYNDSNNTWVDSKTGFFIKRMNLIVTKFSNENEDEHEDNDYEKELLENDDENFKNENKNELNEESFEEETLEIDTSSQELSLLLYNNKDMIPLRDTIMAICNIIGVFLTDKQVLNCVHLANIRYQQTHMTDGQYRVYKKQQGNNKIRELSEINDSVILFSSASALSVIIYTSTPPIQVSRVVSGCLMFFTKDKIASYFACVLKQMKQSNSIFKSVSKMKESSIIDAINKTINDISKYELAVMLENEREIYDSTLTTYSLNDNRSSSVWSRFLPYQVPPGKISPSLNNLSYELQYSIQEIVNMELPLLLTKSKKAYLENTCCTSSSTMNVMDYFIKNDKKKRIEKIINEIIPIDIYCCDKSYSPSFNSNTESWLNPTPKNMITNKRIEWKKENVVKSSQVLPKLTLNNSPEWVKQTYNFINNKINNEQIMNQLLDNMNNKIKSLHDGFKNNDKGKINIESWYSKNKLFSDVEIMLWKDIAIQCCIIFPLTISHNTPDKINIIENIKWKVKHWELSDKHYMDIQSFLVKNIIKYKPWFNKSKKLNPIFSLDFWNWLSCLISSNIIIDKQIIYFICINTILDAFVAMFKIDNIYYDFVKTIILSINEIKKYVLKSEKELSDSLFKLAQAEKNLITDRLKSLSEDDRKLDNVMKNLQLGDWSIGQMKGLVSYDMSFYDDQRQFVEAINKEANTDDDNEMSDFNNLKEDWMTSSESDELI
jgi:hypothetical protein